MNSSSARLIARLAPARAPQAAAVGEGRGSRGFTLIEMLVAVAVTGVLLAAGLPAMQGVIAGFGVSSQTDELASVMRFARSEALRRGATVSVCSSTDPNSTTPACAGTADWTAGWLVFHDANSDGSLAAGERVIRVHSVLGKVASITGGTGQSAVRFGANGIAVSGSARLLIKPKGTAGTGQYDGNTRTLCLNPQGRVSFLKGDVSC